MIKKILIANRGEIAVRIIRACKELGITAAAVYSDVDLKSLHAKLADESYHIGPSPATESYLNSKKIISIAKKIKADAIHPGYGFFAENADFIKECEKEGITFIGPSSKSVAMMGNKTEARKIMAKHKVPIVPGTVKPISSLNEGLKEAEKVGYPLLLKAAAGGGGKGMRKITSAKEFKSAFEATKRESLKAFASDEIYIEKFIENPKHIEVQIFADKHGNFVHLFERECSIQRRHQKIIEESPSSFVDDATRKKITTAAINAAKACKYVNAGTVEFLMDAKKNFYFLEMNTRLQVEHPVTELITGFDLVKEQIAVASGKKLSFKQSDIKMNGHAIECRVYAEDPVNNFLPTTGQFYEYIEPAGPGIRVDSGFNSSSEISVFYDPLISKVVAWAKNRNDAIERMKRALGEYHIAGVSNNLQFLLLIIDHKDFKSGKFDINFLNASFMKSFQKLEKKKAKNEMEIVAAAFASLIKRESAVTVSGNNSANTSRWQEQIYE